MQIKTQRRDTDRLFQNACVHIKVGKSSLIINIFNAKYGQIIQHSILETAVYLHLISQAKVLNGIIPIVTACNTFIISILLSSSI